MIIARIYFDSTFSVPGIKTRDAAIDPSGVDWIGWTWEVVGDRLVGTSPPGFLCADGRELPLFMRADLDACGMRGEEARLVVSEPLSRVRLVMVGDDAMLGDMTSASGPSHALRDARAAVRQRTAEQNAALTAARAAAPPPPVAAAIGARAPKRPPWAKTPVVPPPPVDEDGP